MKKVISIFLSLILMSSATSCVIKISESESDESSESSTSSVSETASSLSANDSSGLDDKSTSEVSTSSSEEPSSNDDVDKNVATIGDYAENDTWKISFLDAKTYSEIKGETEYLTTSADDGKEYLVLFFEVENISDEDDYFNYYNITAYEDNYATNIEVLLGGAPEGYDMLVGDVAAGRMLKGYLAWQVDADWEKFEMTYSADLFNNSDRCDFIIYKSDIS